MKPYPALPANGCYGHLFRYVAWIAIADYAVVDMFVSANQGFADCIEIVYVHGNKQAAPVREAAEA